MDKLAIENIIQIVSNLKDKQSTLAELVRLSRTMHKLTLPYLYHTPQFNTWKQFDLFSKQLTSYTGLFVRQLDLSTVPRRWEPGINRLLESLISKTPHLHTLNLELCLRLTNKTLIEMIKPILQLHLLNLEQCTTINDKSIESVVQYCPQLEEIYLGSTNITDRSLTLLTQLEHLTEVYMPGCEKITEVGVKKLYDGSRSLKHVDIQNCYNVVGDFGTVEEEEEDFGN